MDFKFILFTKTQMYKIILVSITMMSSISQKFNFSNLFSYPRLDTILMVEEQIKNAKKDYKRKELWETLPKKMKYQTFKIIINYLLYSHKIGIDKKRYIIWLENNSSFLKKVLKKGVEVLD